eukprot:scaffold1083_cov114-Cylindrotheca_fusiformis.AAC.10
MTTRWYAAVLQRLPKHSRVLDVGIGTAGALINCSELVKERDLKIVGIDYDAAYVTQATRAVKKAGLQDSIQVYQKSVYDLSTEDGTFDAVYFSGSFTLLPDPCEALRVVRALTKHRVFITQTYQRKSPPLLGYIKPLLKYITTIDFGKLMTEEESLDLFAHIIPKECHMRLVQHEVIQGSIDTYLQAAYLSILEPVL